MQNIRIRSLRAEEPCPLFGEGIPILTAFLELTRITVPRGAPRERGRESVAPPSATFPSEQSDEIEFSLNGNGFLRMSKREGPREASDPDACPAESA